MQSEDLPCVEKLQKTAKRILVQESAIKKESKEQRILFWNEVRENYNKYLEGECGVFLLNSPYLDKCFHGDFTAALLILAISFADNGESFAPAERFSENERKAYKKITQYNVFESRTSMGIGKKLKLQSDETLALWYFDYQDMKKWVDTILKDPGMDEHVRYYLNNKWSEYCRNSDKALKDDPRIPPPDDPKTLMELKQLLTDLQEKAKKLTRYESLTTGSFTEAQGQISARRYDDARKTLIRVEPIIDTLLECESLLAVWRVKGYTLTELEGLLPRNADDVRPAFHKTEQNTNRLEIITQELERITNSYPNLREQPETASIIHSIEQNLKNPARIDTVEREYQQLNNAIRQQKIIEQDIRDQLENVRWEVSSSELKPEIALIEKSIQQRGISYAQELLKNLAEKELSKVTAVLSKFRIDGTAFSLFTDTIRKQINAQNYGAAIIDSGKVIAEWNSIEGSRFVKVADAKMYEMNFIGRTGRNIDKIEKQIVIGGRIFIFDEITHGSNCPIVGYISHIKRQLTPNEKQNLPENQQLTARLVEKKFLDLGAKERYTFRALFLSRPEKYAKFGFDTKPLALTDINPVLNDALNEAKQIRETVFLCIASPTGFEPDLRTFIDGDAFHKRFTSQDLSVCFIDLETAAILVNPHDKVAASFRPLCEMEFEPEKTEKVKRILYPLVDDQLIYPGHSQYPEVLEQCRKKSGFTDELIIKKVFYQYATEKGLPVRFINDVGLVIMK